MTTMQQFIRILSVAGVEPDHVICCNIHADTSPELVHVLVEDGIAYITEKR